jgi:hypothetical protein
VAAERGKVPMLVFEGLTYYLEVTKRMVSMVRAMAVTFWGSAVFPIRLEQIGQ